MVSKGIKGRGGEGTTRTVRKAEGFNNREHGTNCEKCSAFLDLLGDDSPASASKNAIHFAEDFSWRNKSAGEYHRAEKQLT